MFRKTLLKRAASLIFRCRPIPTDSESGSAFIEVIAAAAILLIGLSTLTVHTTLVLQTIQQSREIGQSGEIAGIVLETVSDETLDSSTIGDRLKERFPGYEFFIDEKESGLYELSFSKKTAEEETNQTVYRTLFFREG